MYSLWKKINMYYKVYIPENSKIEQMRIVELLSLQSYYYYNSPQTKEQIREQQAVQGRISFIQDQTHT